MSTNEKENPTVKEETVATTETNTETKTPENGSQNIQPAQPELPKPVETDSKQVLDEILTFLKQNQVNQKSYLDAVKELRETQEKLTSQLKELDEIVKENTPRIVKSFEYDKEVKKYDKEIEDTRKIAEEAFKKMQQES